MVRVRVRFRSEICKSAIFEIAQHIRASKLRGLTNRARNIKNVRHAGRVANG